MAAVAAEVVAWPSPCRNRVVPAARRMTSASKEGTKEAEEVK